MRSLKIELTGCCYVLHQGIYNEILEYKNDLVMYPEQSMTLLELATGQRWPLTIVTENPWLISCYDQESVFICRNGVWQNPPQQTFGCSVNMIMSQILGIKNTIPANIISSDTATDLEKKVQFFYKKT